MIKTTLLSLAIIGGFAIAMIVMPTVTIILLAIGGGVAGLWLWATGYKRAKWDKRPLRLRDLFTSRSIDHSSGQQLMIEGIFALCCAPLLLWVYFLWPR